MIHALEAFQVLGEFTAADVYNIVIKAYYFPVFYIFHAIYVCVCLRCTSKSGFQWYRSFIVGLVMTAGPRYIFSKLCDASLEEFEGNNMACICFACVWACLNIFPFDLLFKCAMVRVIRCTIQFLDAVSQAQNMVQLGYGGVYLFPGQPLRVITINSFCMCVPLIVDVIDRKVIGERNCPMAYQFNYIKRVLLTVGAVVLLVDQSILGWSVHPNHIFLGTSLAYLFLAAIDVAVADGLFETADFLFPNFLTTVATYWPSVGAGNVASAAKVKAE